MLGNYLKILGMHFLLSQSEVTPKPVVTQSHMLTHTSGQVHVCSMNFDWFAGFSVSLFIGQSDYFGL